MEPLRDLTVLVVDDSDEFRGTLVQYLNSIEGITVVSEAKSGREAILLVRSLSPDVVLLDISMPGLKGPEAARLIKMEWPDTRIIFVSIHDERSYRRLTRGVPVDGYVNKDHLVRDLPPLLRRLRRPLKPA